jgi:hypothetical protein
MWGCSPHRARPARWRRECLARLRRFTGPGSAMRCAPARRTEVSSGPSACRLGDAPPALLGGTTTGAAHATPRAAGSRTGRPVRHERGAAKQRLLRRPAAMVSRSAQPSGSDGRGRPARMRPTTTAPPGIWKVPGMRFAIVPEAVLQAALPASELRVIVALALHANAETGWCSLNRATLTRWTRMGAKEISIATTSLVAKGWLHKMRRGRRCNEYYLRVPPTHCAPHNEAGVDDAPTGGRRPADASSGVESRNFP